MSEEKLYDLSTVKEFVGDDPEQIAGLVMIFLEDVPDMLEKLNDSHSKGDLDQVKFFAHKLKSSIDLFKVDAITSVIRELEEYSKNRTNTETIPVLLDKVNQSLSSTLLQLRDDYKL